MTNLEAFNQLVKKACCGNHYAELFLHQICTILHFFDDVADGDKEIKDVEGLTWLTLCGYQMNPFYREHFQNISVLLGNSIINWKVANVIERSESSSETELQTAFIIRSSYVDLVAYVATVCGGFEHGANIAKEAHQLWHIEGFQKYQENLEAELNARGGK